MPTLQLPGVGSGLDINSLVTQLMAVERAPVEQRIARKETRIDMQLSALGTLKGALAGLQTSLDSLRTAADFQVRKATSSNEQRFTASASSDAAAGTYAIEVVRLATAQKLVSEPFGAGSSAVVGTGTLTITVGAESFDVTVDAESNTLAGIRDAINSAADNTGVQATIISTTMGSRLVLTAKETGAANTLRVTQAGGDGGLAQLVYDPPNASTFAELEAAADAHIRIEGFDYEAASNVITDAIDGITLHLLEAEEGTTLSLTVANDTSQALTRVKKFVTDYNTLAGTIANLRRYDASSREAGPLLGDAMLRSIESELRSMMSESVTTGTSPYQTLASIGITTGKDGRLEIDETALTEVLETEFDAVGALFGSADGVAARTCDYLDAVLAADAPMASRLASLQSSKKRIATEKTDLERRMEAVEARYRAQFGALDRLLAGLQSTASYLSQQLGNLPRP